MLTFMTIITQILQMLCVTQPAISISDVMYVTVSGGRSTTLANATLSLSHFLNQFFPLRAFQENVVLIWDVPRSQFFSFHNFANNAVFVFMQKFSKSVKNLKNVTLIYVEQFYGGVIMELLTIKEVAKRLRLSSTTVHKLIESGEFPAYRFGNATRIPKAEFETWVSTTKVSQEGGK